MCATISEEKDINCVAFKEEKNDAKIAFLLGRTMGSNTAVSTTVLT